MITDEQLNTIALTFGFASIILIIIYHAISTNVHKLEDETHHLHLPEQMLLKLLLQVRIRSNN